MIALEKMIEKHPGVIIENSEPHTDSKADTKEALLTDREKEVLKLIAEGLPTKEIAEKIFISPKTVATHKANIKSKLNFRTTGEIIRFAVRNGF